MAICKRRRQSGAVHGFCGIAKPEKFRASLAAQGYQMEGFTSFADHHNFTEAEAAKLLAHDTPLITTEKDMARLRARRPTARAPHWPNARQFYRLP